MPYGIAKSAGGDSRKNVLKTEMCVKKLMQKGYSKEKAIRICKSSLFKRKRG